MKHERRRHLRVSARPPRGVDLTYETADGNQVSCRTRNIGVGGAFIATGEPLAVGSTIEVCIQVPGASEPIRVSAEVRWIEDGGLSDNDPGMGVQFAALDPEHMITLTNYFASLTLAEFEP